MATSTLAEYANLAGAPVTVTERRVLFGLFDLSYAADCGGCGARLFERQSEYYNNDPEGKVRGWAEKHAGQCRRRS